MIPHPLSSDALPEPLSYAEELKRNRRVLGAVCTGMGSGWLLNHYIANLFAPYLLDEFGWAKSDFAFLGSLGIFALFVLPIIGRLTDLVGVRPVAMIGIVAFPVTFVAFSLMDGRLAVFAIITITQVVLTSATTASTVYSRLIAERFVAARGSALALAATTPALVGLLATPFLSRLIEAEGWRTGYIAVALYTAVLGALTLFLIPRSPSGPPDKATKPRRSAKRDYATILRSRELWIIAGGFLFCNLIYPLQSSQMNIMLIEQGATQSLAASMLSIFAAGVLLGRFACGFALDRFPADRVAAIMLGLPTIGLLALGSGLGGTAILAASVLLMGLSLGAESDLAAYLVIRYFNIEVYGTVLSLVVSVLALSGVSGAFLLALTLDLFGHFGPYMLIAAAGSALGAVLFLLLGCEGIREPARTTDDKLRQ